MKCEKSVMEKELLQIKYIEGRTDDNKLSSLSPCIFIISLSSYISYSVVGS